MNQLSDMNLANIEVNTEKAEVTITVPLYCICRSTHVIGNNMVRCDQCHEWYHQDCTGIGNETFEHIA